MQVRALPFGAFVVTPTRHGDARGHFAETFRADVLAEHAGHAFTLAQVNTSVSRRGSVRGIHFALVPPGQAKYVSAAQGRFLDVLVDIREGSPTFGEHAAVELDAERHDAVYVPEGLGHGFCALTEWATASYLCSTPYTPSREFGLHPLDPALNLPWPDDTPLTLSDRDADAPTLAQAAGAGTLPSFAACRQWLARAP